MNGLLKNTVWSLPAIALSLASAGAQDAGQGGGNLWNPNPVQRAQIQQVQPPKYIGDAPVVSTPQIAEPTQPSRFAPADLERRLDNRPSVQNVVPATGGVAMRPNPAPAPQQYFAGPQQGNFGGPGYGPPPPGYGYNGYPPNYNGNGPGYGANQMGYGGYPQGFGGYPQPYGGPNGYGNQGFGSSGSQSFFGFPGNFGSFPGSSTNGGVPGFGFSPFGFF